MIANSQMTAERDRLRTQADTYTKQFDELCNLRTSEPEKLFEAYKQKADARSTGTSYPPPAGDASETDAAAQNDVIKSLTEINDKLQARIQALEKAAKVDEPAAAPVKADPKEVKALKERLTRTESELRSRDRDCTYTKVPHVTCLIVGEWDYTGADLAVTQLDKMYKAEVEASQKLLASRSGTSAPATVAESGTAKEESVKDAAIIRLYEDMSDLCILEVRIKDGKFGPKDKEYTFSCIQTVGKNSTSHPNYSRLVIGLALGWPAEQRLVREDMHERLIAQAPPLNSAHTPRWTRQ